MLSVGTILSNQYEIIEKIGAGGMSIVYKARCKKLQRYVAVKVLRSEFVKDEAFVNSFRAEALSAASLSHPNIVGIYDVGQDQGYHYIIMEYVEGKTLKELIETKAPYDNQTVLKYGMEIISAIRHAHIKRIIHRDIKPQNILITSDKILKVTDFGIARAVDSSTLVSTGSAIGSVHYFSPEQARGKYVDETSDIYSCGIVLFELATGRLPFEADSHVTVALKHINEDIPLPTQFNKDITPSLEAIILKATQKRPELRYQAAEDMLHDMQQLSVDPFYKIPETTINNSQETILMTPEETDFIRNNSKVKGDLDIPNWQRTNSGKNPQQIPSSSKKAIEDGEEVSATYNLMVTLAGILAAMVLIGIVTFLAFPLFAKMNKPKVAVVPHIIGANLETAIQSLEDVGLKINVVGEEEQVGTPGGKVIRQAPDRDQIVDLGSMVEVIVSKESQIIEEDEIEDVMVPDVTGIQFTDAQIDLEKVNLQMRIERQTDDKIEMGIVISQYPLPRNTLKPGDIVTLIVSKGKEIIEVVVPNVLNMDESTAIATLQRAGLNVGKIDHEEDDEVEEGRIISQSVPGSRKIEQSETVSIVVSKGKPKEELPPAETIKTLSITIPSFLEEKEEYLVSIKLYSENGEVRTIYEGIVKWDEFPISVNVKGTGKGTVETFIDGKQAYTDPIDFDEVTE